MSTSSSSRTVLPLESAIFVRREKFQDAVGKRGSPGSAAGKGQDDHGFLAGVLAARLADLVAVAGVRIGLGDGWIDRAGRATAKQHDQTDCQHRHQAQASHRFSLEAHTSALTTLSRSCLSGICNAATTIIGNAIGTRILTIAPLPIGNDAHPLDRVVHRRRVRDRPDLRRVEDRRVVDRLAQNPAPVNEPPLFADERGVGRNGAAARRHQRRRERKAAAAARTATTGSRTRPRELERLQRRVVIHNLVRPAGRDHRGQRKCHHRERARAPSRRTRVRPCGRGASARARGRACRPARTSRRRAASARASPSPARGRSGARRRRTTSRRNLGCRRHRRPMRSHRRAAPAGRPPTTRTQRRARSTQGSDASRRRRTSAMMRSKPARWPGTDGAARHELRQPCAAPRCASPLRPG